MLANESFVGSDIEDNFLCKAEIKLLLSCPSIILCVFLSVCSRAFLLTRLIILSVISYILTLSFSQDSLNWGMEDRRQHVIQIIRLWVKSFTYTVDESNDNIDERMIPH